MAVWLPALKLALPYITQVVSAAVPAFTASRNAKAPPEEVIPKQIAELQEAVTHNAESLKILATQMHQVMEGMETGAGRMQQELAQELAQTRRLCRWAIGSSLAAGAIGLAALAVWLP